MLEKIKNINTFITSAYLAMLNSVYLLEKTVFLTYKMLSKITLVSKEYLNKQMKN